MRTYLKYLFIFIMSLLAVGCDDYLEETPDNRVDLNNLQKAAQLLTSAYPQGAYNFTEWMSDNVAFTEGTTKEPLHEEAYHWEDVSDDDQDTPTFFWTSSYEAIAHANEVLAALNELPGDEELRQAVRAEALLTRAYAHFMLVNLFAKSYDWRSAGADPGIPYVEEPEREFIKTYNRLSVKQVYERVERDLLAGLEIATDKFYANSGKYHFTREAALAFASRFYLFQGDFVRCVQYSSELLGDEPQIFVRDFHALVRESINPDDFTRRYAAPTEEANLLLMRKSSFFYYNNYGFWPDNQIIRGTLDFNPLFVNDARFEELYVAGGSAGDGVMVLRFETLFERSSLSSNTGLPYTIVVAFKGEEVLLNRAESYIYLNEPDKALADLQVLAARRYGDGDEQIVLDMESIRTFYGIHNDDQLALLNYILDERRKEFLHEGLRWFDIKRYGLPVTHALRDGSVITLSPDDLRKVLQIPKAAIDVGGLEPNER